MAVARRAFRGVEMQAAPVGLAPLASNENEAGAMISAPSKPRAGIWPLLFIGTGVVLSLLWTCGLALGGYRVALWLVAD